VKQALTIAGSDSGGGAGIQADLKTFHAHGVFGTSVITAITAQNTVAVTHAVELPADIIEAQFDAVLDDFDIAACKTGMLSSRAIVQTVAACLRRRPISSLVVDPVMVSKSGHTLLAGDAVESVTHDLLPLAHVVTPNIHEAEWLTGMSIKHRKDMEQAARRILEYGCRNVLVKGGHSPHEPATDILYDGSDYHVFASSRVDGRSRHGTGCTLSAAIAARLALGEPLLKAVEHAKIYITQAITYGLDIGKGHGPTNHFYFLRSEDFLKGD
jgi:hydroxymethylpyrimidine/phosphomethylpyrimidine kinase